MRHNAIATTYRVLFGMLLLLLGFAGGWFCAVVLGGQLSAAAITAAWNNAGAQPTAAEPVAVRQQFGLFWEVWDLVETKLYVRQPLDHTRMIRGAVKGMLAELDDPYTVYQEPDLAAQSQEYLRGSAEGIGVAPRITDGRTFITKPAKDSPAARASLQQGDEIVQIDGKDLAAVIAGADINQATTRVAALIRGPKGSTVTLLMRRGDGPPFAVALQRDTVVVSSINGQMLGTLAYIQITDFKSTTTADFDATLRDLLAHQPSGIILDLRNNPGGYLTPAQDILGRFYSGVALYEQDSTGTLKPLNTNAGSADLQVFSMPVAVLVNHNSASASEIVAGALRDERANTVLVGEQTYGKGSVQNIYTLSDGGNARITSAHWLTPKQAEINKHGVTPQYLVPANAEPALPVPCIGDQQPAASQTTCIDTQLAWGIKLLNSSEKPPTFSPTATP